MEKIIIEQKEKKELVEAYNEAIARAKGLKKDVWDLNELIINKIKMSMDAVSQALFETMQTDIEGEITRAFWDEIFHRYLHLRIPFNVCKANLAIYQRKEYPINMENLNKFEKEFCASIHKIWVKFFDWNFHGGRTIEIEGARNEYGSLTEQVKDVVWSFDLFGLLMDGYKNSGEIYNKFISANFIISGVTYETDYLKMRTFKGDRYKIRLTFKKKLQRYVNNFIKRYGKQ